MNYNKPTMPIKPIEPTINSIMPKKENYSAKISFSVLFWSIVFIAGAGGLGVFAYYFYTGNMEIPVLGFLTTIIYLFCYTSGVLAVAALLFGLFLLLVFLISVFSQPKLNKKYKADLEYYNNNKNKMLDEALKKYEEALEKYKIAEEQYNKDLKEYKEYINNISFSNTTYSSYDSDTGDYNSNDDNSSEENESIYLRDGSGSSIGLKISDGKITGNDGYGLHYYVDEDNGRISSLNGDTKGYIKSDGTITDIDGWTKGRITEDGRVVDVNGNTIAHSAEDLDKVIEDLNKY